MDEVLELSTKRKELHLTIDSSDYLLREMDGPSRDDFLAKAANRTKFDSDGNPIGMKDVKGSTADLISRHLFDVSGKQVPVEVIQPWSSTVLEVLSRKCVEISGLGKHAKAEAKND